MGKSVTEVVKIVAPIALEALAEAAEALLAGAPLEAEVAARVAALDDPSDWGSTIYNDTSSYITTQFANTFDYYYAGLASKPLTGTLPVAAGMDIVVYDEHNELSDINGYLQAVFKDSLSPADSIELANNLSTLIADRFKEESLEWTPFDKRYNFPDNVIIDTYMVTACAHDTGNDLAGVVTYCFVAYSAH